MIIPYTELKLHINTDLIQQASTLGAISPDTVEWMLQEGELSLLAEGEVLFEPEERGDSFFIILEGSFAYSKFHKDRYAFIRNFTQGQQIGFMSMIALHDRVGRAVADEKSLILKVCSELFHRLHQHAPLDFGILMMNLAREMARSLRYVDNLVVKKSDSKPEEQA